MNRAPSTRSRDCRFALIGFRWRHLVNPSELLWERHAMTTRA